MVRGVFIEIFISSRLGGGVSLLEPGLSLPIDFSRNRTSLGPYFEES